jgi:hypothetical protein
MKRILALIALAAPLLVAQADRWSLYFVDAVHCRSYLDTQTIQYRYPSAGAANDYVSVWRQSLEPSGARVMVHNDLHFSTRHIRILSAVVYDVEGKVIASSDQPTAWEDIVPGCIGSIRMDD